ncbi:MAG TPA: 5-dehydro-4-deoxyglucarate dehydratase [Steroidobacteraceae bacterium]
MLAPDVLKVRIAEGIMAFPATPFRGDGSLDLPQLAAHVDFLAQHAPSALAAAGGAGEIFSLSLAEHAEVVRAAVLHGRGIPVIGGAAYGTQLACAMARAVEQAGADAVLLLPPYLVHCEQEGLYRHIRAVCDSVAIAVIPYSRDNAVLAPDTVFRLADDCPNLVGLKDGTGDLAAVSALQARVGGRLTILNGAPTAEMFAPQCRTVSIHCYSSAVFTFLPLLARHFYGALRDGREALVEDMLSRFYRPLVKLRQRKRGYSVSIVKAGLRVVGRPAGPVRPPLLDFDASESAMLAELIAGASAWAGTRLDATESQT